MIQPFVPIAMSDWKKGDYRMAASLKGEYWSIEALAAKVSAKLENFVEPGLGNGRAFAVRTSIGRQFGFDEYEGGKGPNLLLLFENGTCRKSEVMDVLSFFGVLPEHVYWFAPELLKDDQLPERWEGMHLLPVRWREFLRNAPETGMGYQTGNVTLKDGSIFQDVVFMNPYLGGICGHGHGDIPFKTDDIEGIELTHKRWKW